MKKQHIIVLFLLLMITPCLRAQKKELSQARTYIKSGKNLDKAEKLMTDLLAGSAENRENKKIYSTWLEAVQGQYAAANELLYLKQKYDTAAFFNLTRRMYLIAETLDSLDMRPDEKGRVKLEYRKDNAEMLNQLRPNLFNGGTYHVRKNEYQQAYDFFETYLDAASQPLFMGYDYQNSDRQLPQAAYWATFCGFKLQDSERTLRYSQQALKDEKKAMFTMQYMCEAYEQQKNEAVYTEMLRRGFERYPQYPYFFPRLADYYNACERSDSVLVIADRGLQVNSDNPLFLMAKSMALLSLERYDESVEVSEKLISLDAMKPEPYFNIATAYLNQALALEKKNEPRRYRSQIEEYYKKARPYMEQFRQLMPQAKERWAPGLYRIYLNLNMGKQFDEIDQLMKKN